MEYPRYICQINGYVRKQSTYLFVSTLFLRNREVNDIVLNKRRSARFTDFPSETKCKTICATGRMHTRLHIYAFFKLPT